MQNFLIKDDHCLLVCYTKNELISGISMIDLSDVEKCKLYKWHFNAGYIKRGDRLPLHNFLLNIKPSRETPIDHKNGNKLDNRKQNLRVCTPKDNRCNTSKRYGSSKFKGVSYYKIINKWRASIKVNGNDVYLGIFEKEMDAAIAYDMAAKIHHGEFANLNFVDKI